VRCVCLHVPRPWNAALSIHRPHRHHGCQRVLTCANVCVRDTSAGGGLTDASGRDTFHLQKNECGVDPKCKENMFILHTMLYGLWTLITVSVTDSCSDAPNN
jgi:hypothetical protein